MSGNWRSHATLHFIPHAIPHGYSVFVSFFGNSIYSCFVFFGKHNQYEFDKRSVRKAGSLSLQLIILKTTKSTAVQNVLKIKFHDK